MPGRSNAYTSSPSVSQTSSGGVHAWLERAAARAGDSKMVLISRSNSPFMATFRSGSRKRTRVVIELNSYQLNLPINMLPRRLATHQAARRLLVNDDATAAAQRYAAR